MFDAFTSVVLLLPAALFGRRRGGDRHGEVAGAPAPEGAGDDAFSAFEDVVLQEHGGDPDGFVGDVVFAKGDLEESAADAAVLDAASHPLDPPAVDVASVDDAAATTPPAAVTRSAEAEVPVQASRDAAAGASVVDPSLVDAPGWVVGETSLDSHAGAIDHASVVPDQELWHPAPGDLARLEAPAPFEEQLGAAMPSTDVWGPVAVEPVPAASGTMGAAPFRLNRLKRVAGPTDGGVAGSVAVARDDRSHEDGAPIDDAPGGSNGNGSTSNGSNGNGSNAGGGRLISGPVGRSRARTGGRHVRRPLPIGSLTTGDQRGGGAGAGNGTVDRGADGPGPAGEVDRPAGPRPDHRADPRSRERGGTAVTPTGAIAGDANAGVPDGDVPVFVSADGTVAIGTGSVRVARPEDASASGGPDGLVVHLTDHWCWAALDELGPDLTVRAGSTVLHVPAGTTALLSIDDDGSQLVVVLDGEAVVDDDGTRIQLRSGAMAYLPVDGDPQVDVAEDDEIRADPLVARNLRLDQV